jgi:phosphohistidine phosphatase
MKRLYLLRHAKSSWAQPGLGDIDRTLNNRGNEQCRTLSKWWVANGRQIDGAVVSSAQRTRETFYGLETALNFEDVQFFDELYLGSLDNYLSALWAQTGETTLLIGHNPTCDELARYLTAPSSPAADKLMAHHFGTASLAVFECDIESWSELGRSQARLMDFVRPKDIEKSDVT